VVTTGITVAAVTTTELAGFATVSVNVTTFVTPVEVARSRIAYSPGTTNAAAEMLISVTFVAGFGENDAVIPVGGSIRNNSIGWGTPVWGNTIGTRVVPPCTAIIFVSIRTSNVDAALLVVGPELDVVTVATELATELVVAPKIVDVIDALVGAADVTGAVTGETVDGAANEETIGAGGTVVSATVGTMSAAVLGAPAFAPGFDATLVFTPDLDDFFAAVVFAFAFVFDDLEAASAKDDILSMHRITVATAAVRRRLVWSRFVRGVSVVPYISFPHVVSSS
jgi:hypothetical protein